VGFEFAVAPALTGAVAPVLDASIAPAVVDGGTVLDVGSGGGTLATWLSVTRGVAVLGVDPSATQVRRLERTARRVPRVAAIRGTAEHLPVADGVAAAVVSSCAFKHWLDPAAGVAACVRALRLNGRCAIVELDRECGVATFAAFAASTRVPRVLRGAYVRFTMRTAIAAAPTLSEFAATLRSQRGAEVVEVRRLEGLPFVLGVLVRTAQ
jgi:SAM-dependent methyltransferase